MAELANIQTPKLKMFTCEVYSGRNIIYSVDVQANNEMEAVELAAKSLKIKPKKKYKDE